jgi:hypothetical protein
MSPIKFKIPIHIASTGVKFKCSKIRMETRKFLIRTCININRKFSFKSAHAGLVTALESLVVAHVVARRHSFQPTVGVVVD